MSGAGAKCKTISPESELGKLAVVADYLVQAKGKVTLLECDYPFVRNPVPDEKKRDHKNNPAEWQRGWVVLADPPPEVLDGWITSACRVGAPNNTGCVGALQQYIASKSGGHFPVLGFVSEGRANCKQFSKPVKSSGLISFQHGVTVQRAAAPDEEREGIYCGVDGWGASVQSAISRTHKIVETYNYARLSGLHKSCWEPFVPEAQRQLPKDSKVHEWWLSAARDNHINALRTGDDSMMELQARRFAQGMSFDADCKPASQSKRK